MKLRECTLLASTITFIIFLGGYTYEWITASEMALVTAVCAVSALGSLYHIHKKGW